MLCSGRPDGRRWRLGLRDQAFLNPKYVDPVAAGKAAAEPCTNCHGENGVSHKEGVPSLIGLHPKYLVETMQSFKGGCAMSGRWWRLDIFGAVASTTSRFANASASGSHFPIGSIAQKAQDSRARAQSTFGVRFSEEEPT